MNGLLIKLYYYFNIILFVKSLQNDYKSNYNVINNNLEYEVLILGAGGSGLLTALELNKMKVKNILIDNKEFIEYTPSLITALTKFKNNTQFVSYYSKIVKNYNSILSNSNYNYIKFLQGNVLEIMNNNQIKITNFVQKNVNYIRYKYLVYSLGSSYSNNKMIFKSSTFSDKLIMLKDRLKYLSEERNKFINLSKKVLIIGGGSVGTELGSNLYNNLNNNKLVTLVHSKNKLTNPDIPDMGLEKDHDQGNEHFHTEEDHHHDEDDGHEHIHARSLMKRHKEFNGLSRYNIKFPHEHAKSDLLKLANYGSNNYNTINNRGFSLVLNDKAYFHGKSSNNEIEYYKLQKLNKYMIQADYVFETVGLIPNTTPLKKYYSNFLDKKGFIKVNKNTFQFLDSNSQDNMFALGDVSNLFTDIKQFSSAQRQAMHFAENFYLIKQGRFNQVKPFL